jgi:hypothetical protein
VLSGAGGPYAVLVCGSASDGHMCECVFEGTILAPHNISTHNTKKHTSAKPRQKNYKKKGQTLAALMKIYSLCWSAPAVFCSFNFWAASRF